MNEEFTLTKGHLYRIHSRNLPYGVYDGRGGFIGIREKFGNLYLFTELDCDQGAPYGTVRVLEDLGPIAEGIEPVEGTFSDDPKERYHNQALYEYLAESERIYGRGVGYGGRPSDPEVPREDDGD